MKNRRIAVTMKKASSPEGIYPFKASAEELPSRLAQLMHINNRVFTRQADKLIQQGELKILTTRDAYLFTISNNQVSH